MAWNRSEQFVCHWYSVDCVRKAQMALILAVKKKQTKKNSILLKCPTKTQFGPNHWSIIFIYTCDLVPTISLKGPVIIYVTKIEHIWPLRNWWAWILIIESVFLESYIHFLLYWDYQAPLEPLPAATRLKAVYMLDSSPVSNRATSMQANDSHIIQNTN